MNDKGYLGSVFLLIFLVLALTAFAFIDPLKEVLNANRDGSPGNLNCPGTSNFNQTAYDAQSSGDKLNYRSTCATTGFAMLWLVGAVLTSGAAWVWRNWK